MYSKPICMFIALRENGCIYAWINKQDNSLQILCCFVFVVVVSQQQQQQEMIHNKNHFPILPLRGCGRGLAGVINQSNIVHLSTSLCRFVPTLPSFPFPLPPLSLRPLVPDLSATLPQLLHSGKLAPVTNQHFSSAPPEGQQL